MRELRGKAVADALKEKMKAYLERIDEADRPQLAIVRVGERPDDLAYEGTVLKKCGVIGLPVRPRNSGVPASAGLHRRAGGHPCRGHGKGRGLHESAESAVPDG